MTQAPLEKPDIWARFEAPEGVRRVGPGVFEIMGHVGRRKLISGIGSVGILAAGLAALVFAPDLWSGVARRVGYGVAWGGEHNFHRGYDLCISGPSYPGCHPDMTPWEFVWNVHFKFAFSQGHLDDDIMLLAFVLLLPAIFLLRRRPAPVRIDGPRRIAYTWARPRLFGLLGRGGLHIAGRRGIKIEARDHIDAPQRGAVINPLIVELGAAEAPARTRRFKIGPMDPKVISASGIWSTLAVPAMADDDFALGLTERLPDRFRIPWWQRISLRRPRDLPADIDARAAAWADAAAQRGDPSVQRMGDD